MGRVAGVGDFGRFVPSMEGSEIGCLSHDFIYLHRLPHKTANGSREGTMSWGHFCSMHVTVPVQKRKGSNISVERHEMYLKCIIAIFGLLVDRTKHELNGEYVAKAVNFVHIVQLKPSKCGATMPRTKTCSLQMTCSQWCDSVVSPFRVTRQCVSQCASDFPWSRVLVTDSEMVLEPEESESGWESTGLWKDRAALEME